MNNEATYFPFPRYSHTLGQTIPVSLTKAGCLPPFCHNLDNHSLLGTSRVGSALAVLALGLLCRTSCTSPCYRRRVSYCSRPFARLCQTFDRYCHRHSHPLGASPPAPPAGFTTLLAVRKAGMIGGKKSTRAALGRPRIDTLALPHLGFLAQRPAAVLAYAARRRSAAGAGENHVGRQQRNGMPRPTNLGPPPAILHG